MVSELIDAVRAKSDKTKVSVFTRCFRFDGYIHTPKVGKESRRLSDTLNTTRNFLTLTSVLVTNLADNMTDPTVHTMLQVSLVAIEYVKPHLEE